MQSLEHINLQSDFDYSVLTSINGIKFTNRQIDVIACLIGRQRYKEIGKILSISPSTVDEHLSKIKSIIRNTDAFKSTELLGFFEKSRLYNYLKVHYVKLLIQHNFENMLHKIARHYRTNENYLIKYHNNINKHCFLNKKLRGHLKFLGITLDVDKNKRLYNEDDFEKNIIYVVPKSADIGLEQTINNFKSVIYITQQFEQAIEEKEVSKKASNSYYDGFFKLLKIIFKNLEVECFFKEFEEQESTLKNNFINHGLSNQLVLAQQDFDEHEKQTYRTTIRTTGNLLRQHKVISSAILLAVMIILTFSGMRHKYRVIDNQKVKLSTFNLPHQLNYYTPRSDLTKLIWNTLTEEGSNKAAVLVGLHGLGGIGKTTLAINAIQNPNRNYEFRGWFRAETKDVLRTDYFELGEKMSLFTKDMSDKLKISSVKDWLNSKKNTLLIYDNATDMEGLVDFLPDDGHIIVTSRNYKLSGSIEVDIMTEKEALNLLNDLIPKQLQQTSDYQQQAKKLIRKLGYLPLAISQAGAYIAENMLMLSDYLKLYEEKKTKLLQEKTLPPGDRHESVYITWDMNIKTIKKHPEGEKALELLDFIAYCHSENIPKTLLIQYLCGKTDNEASMAFNRSLKLLRQYSLVKVFPETISIHRLVHDWVKSKHSKKTELLIIKKGMEAVKLVYPWNNKTIKEITFVKYLIQHAELLLSQIQPLAIDVKLVDLILIVGDSYSTLGNYKQSKRFFNKALAISKKHFGSKHVRITNILHSLGKTYLYLGNYVEAKQVLEEALIIKKKYYGSNHVEIANLIPTLSMAYLYTGNYAKARELSEESLKIKEKLYGLNHIYTAHTLHHIGKVYIHLGDYAKAKQMLEKSLLLKEQHYGADHLHTAYTLHHLGKFYLYTGNYVKAKQFLEKALVIKEKYYSSNHIVVAITLHHLGRAYIQLGNYAKAKKILEKSLAIKEKHFGFNHIHTSYTLHHLGWAYLHLGDYVKAKELLEKTLPIEEKYFGLEHVHVSYILHHLSLAYLHLGDYVKAKELLKKTLTMKQKYFGDNHDMIIFTLNSLGLSYYYLGDYKKAKKLTKKVSDMLIKQYGDKHIFTATVFANLGNMYRVLGKTRESKKLLEQSLAFLQEFYGPDNVNVAKVMGNLGLLYGELGDHAKQSKYLKKALMIFNKHVYPEHIDIKRTLKELKRTNSDLAKNKAREPGYSIMLTV